MEGWKRRTALLLVAASTTLASAALPIAHDRDGGRFHDDDPAGEISSFDTDTGMLVVDLARGGSIGGLVTRWTWIKSGDHECDARAQKLNGGDWCRVRLHGDDGRRDRGDLDDLVPGATVEDALLALKDGRAFFWKVELED